MMGELWVLLSLGENQKFREKFELDHVSVHFCPCIGAAVATCGPGPKVTPGVPGTAVISPASTVTES